VAAVTDYYAQFTPTISFLEPCVIVGTVEAQLDPLKTPAGPAPSLRLRLDSGRCVIVNCVQARLMEEIVRLQPAPGDRVKITYKGQAERAAPGMSPTKEFAVAVRRPDSQTPERADGTSGETASENAPESGT
jgi:hypothetical protein